jgi:pyruvate/2-oxoglutarate dehydrogenase complex dihydrolipoamide acyltransferase (E2) component
VAEVWIRGAVVDLPATVSGTLAEQFARPADTLHPGQILGTVAE